MADELLHVKQEEDPLFSSRNCASNTSFDPSAIEVKVENEFSWEEDAVNFTGVESTIEAHSQKRNRKEVIFGGHSVVADKLPLIKKEEDPLRPSRDCASNTTSFDLSAVKVEVENEFASESNEAINLTENGMRGIKAEKADSFQRDLTSSAESTSISTSCGQFADTSGLTKEEDLGMYVEEEEEGFAPVDSDTCVSFEGKDEDCCDEGLPKMEINQIADEGVGMESSSLEAASVNSTSSFTQRDKNGTSQSPASKRPFPCPNCTATFTAKRYLKRHVVCHSSEKPFSCPQCPSKFNLRSSLNRHLFSHSDDRPFSCPHCSSKFKSGSDLKQHLLTHSDEKRFSCPHCACKFKSKSHLNGHLLTHSNERPFSCPHCSSKFKSRHGLRQHLLTHSDERPFSCPHCSSNFKFEFRLKRHLATHLNERPFSCPHCSSKFKLKEALSRHLLTHSDESPFSCPHCSSKFKHKSGLKQHLMAHSDE